MKQPIIDIGSNSIRLTLYAIRNNHSFQILFREKIMAGLAGYVENGALSKEGIACACETLLEFRHTLELLNIHEAAVFATASLRNISNTREALEKIEAATGFPIEMLSGEEEATLGYLGAMQELELSDGVFTDIGGASTEIVVFKDGCAQDSISFAVGSLSLYRNHVKKILPGNEAKNRIEAVLKEEIDAKSHFSQGKHSPLIGVGGTSRAVLRLAKKNLRSSRRLQQHHSCAARTIDLHALPRRQKSYRFDFMGRRRKNSYAGAGNYDSQACFGTF